MRAARGAGLVLALALGACRSQSTGAREDAGNAALATVGPLLSCEFLLPVDVRELALPGFTLKEERACPTCSPLCTFRSTTEPNVTVSLTYDCRPRDASTDVRALLAPTLRAGGVEVPALGRAAARRVLVPGMVQVVAWDDDTPCVLVVTWLGGDTARAVDVTRTALLATTASALPPSQEEDAGSP